MDTARLRTTDLHKGFTLHLQGGVRLPVLAGIDMNVHAGQCLALDGVSGSGKSTLLRCLYGNYRTDAGTVQVWHRDGWFDLSRCEPRTVLEVRRETIGYVSQFLRVIPRVASIDLVAEPLRALGVAAEEALERAAGWLERLQLPQRLWKLPPATFSGGEQQRVNIARGLIAGHPVLLLDEPTASLDDGNRVRVIDLIVGARQRGTAIVGIFHDQAVREALCTHRLDMVKG